MKSNYKILLLHDIYRTYGIYKSIIHAIDYGSKLYLDSFLPYSLRHRPHISDFSGRYGDIHRYHELNI